MQLNTDGFAKAVGGSSIKIWGQGTFDLQHGPVKLTRELVVPELDDDQCLLRDDLIHRDLDGLMDILNSWKVVIFKG